MPRHWTAEQKARQSAKIHSWRPWAKSTGPKSAEGKAVSSQNVIVGKRNRQKALEQALQEYHAALAKISALTGRRNGWHDI